MEHVHVGETVLNSEQIQRGVKLVANELNIEFARASVVVISVIPGGMLFTADLVRKLSFGVRMDYISCPHTPGDRHNSSEIVYHQNIEIAGQHVVLVDDAVESGGTMLRLVDYLQKEYKPKSISIATLFVKPSRVEIAAKQYFAYEMDNDDLLVGYGLPWQDKYRNLPFISKLINS